MFCFHKWGKLEKCLQYCTKCGKGRSVRCKHVWEVTEEQAIYNKYNSPFGRFYIMTCVHCGEKKGKRITVMSDWD